MRTPQELGRDTTGFDRGRPRWVEAAWMLVDVLFVRSTLRGSAHRRALLSLFGVRLGSGVAVKPGVRVKFPWRLTVGDNAWIGEDAWIDNLGEVTIGANACVSQGAYLCTGSHDWPAPGFDLVVKPIAVEAGAWVGARAVVGPGVTVGEGAVLALGSTATQALEPWGVYAGVPAERRRWRDIREEVA